MLADLPLMSYEFLVTFLPLMIGICRYSRRQKRQGFPMARSSFFLLLIFGLYMIGVFHVTGAGTLWSGLRNGITLRAINLIPFSHDIHLTGYLLNVVMVMPLGFLVPMLYSHQDHLFKILGLGAGLSLLVELSQLTTWRATDVDDLIMNTLGAVLGYLIYKVFAHLAFRKKQPRRLPSAGLLMVPLTVSLSRFFLYDELGFLRLLSR